MKTVNAAKTENTATYYVDVYGDIFETESEARELGITGRIIVDALFVGSANDMRAAALRKYNAA